MPPHSSTLDTTSVGMQAHDFSSVDSAIAGAFEALEMGFVKRACFCLELAIKLANTKEDRKRLHDLGNEIQKAVFAEYMAGIPSSGMDRIELS